MNRAVGWAALMVLFVQGCDGEDSSAAPKHACESCHGEHVRFWRHGGHREIACENCHGAQPGHLVEKADPRPEMGRPDPEHCLSCHRGEKEGEGRIVGMAEHLDYIEKRHVQPVDRERVGGKCSSCHDPHLLE